MKPVSILVLLFGLVTCNEAFVHVDKAKTHHKLLLVSFDGLRWDYVDRAPELEGFKRLRENGVTAEFLKPVFPTQTSPSHFSIATGLFPESHGVVHNCNFNASEGGIWPGSNFYSTLTVNEWWDNGAEPIWITAVKQGLRSGGNLYPGSAANMSGVGATIQVLETAQTPTDEEAWHARIDETMTWFTEQNLDMAALYFEQPDLQSHRVGPDDPSIVDESLPLISRTIVRLLDKIEEVGLTDDLNIIITSDHGFTEIIKDRTEQISLADYVNMSNVEFMFAYAPLALIEPAPGHIDEVYNDLKAADRKMSVYKKEEFPERFHFKNNERITSIIVLADLGYATYPVFPGVFINTGEHGFDNDEVEMRASYFSIGPSFKKNLAIEGFESIHIYELMCHLLGLDPAPNNGSLDVLKGTLEAYAVTTTVTDGTLDTTTVTDGTLDTTTVTDGTLDTTVGDTLSTTSGTNIIHTSTHLVLAMLLSLCCLS